MQANSNPSICFCSVEFFLLIMCSINLLHYLVLIFYLPLTDMEDIAFVVLAWYS